MRTSATIYGTLLRHLYEKAKINWTWKNILDFFLSRDFTTPFMPRSSQRVLFPVAGPTPDAQVDMRMHAQDAQHMYRSSKRYAL